MDLQRLYLTSLIDSDGLNQSKREGIDATFFDDSDCKQVFGYIERHYAEYKKVPSRTAVKQVFPSFYWVEPSEPLEFYIAQLKETYRVKILEEGLLEVNPIYDRDTKAAEDRLRKLIADLNVTQKSFKDLNLTETADDRWLRYEERKAGGVYGVRSGWSKIDYETLGWQKGHFIVLVGQKWSGKSWLMLWLAYQAMLQGERVLFCTKEMSSEEIATRIDSIYASVCYDTLRRAELTGVEETKYKNALDKFGKVPGEGNITVAKHGIHTINDVAQKAVEVDATIVFIDSVYLFDADTKTPQGEVQRRMAISQACKRIAQDELNVPLIVSTQAGRKNSKQKDPDLNNIEWSNAFSQDANEVIELCRDDIDKELSQGWLYLLKVREGTETNTAIGMDFNFMKFPEKLDIQAEPSLNVFTTDEEEEKAELWT